MHLTTKCTCYHTYFQLRCKNKVLGNLHVSLGDLGEMSLTEINNDRTLTLLSDIQLEAKVDTYDGLMSATCKLIHTGEFVSFADTQTLVSIFSLMSPLMV